MSKPAVPEKITVGISISLSGKFSLQGLQALSNIGRESKRTEKPHAVVV